MIDQPSTQPLRPLSPGQKIMVRETFTLLIPSAAYVAALLYSRLFEIAPHLHALFQTDMHLQGDRLMRAVGLAIEHLDDLETIAPELRALGRRHTGYGVVADDYDVVGGALLWTLDRCLGEKFTDDVRRAWADTYAILARTMLDGV
jgi:nitric oxide dioxygenase